MLRRGGVLRAISLSTFVTMPSSALRCRLQEKNYLIKVLTGISSVLLDSDIMKKSGRILIVAELAREYGFKDVGG